MQKSKIMIVILITKISATNIRICFQHYNHCYNIIIEISMNILMIMISISSSKCWSVYFHRSHRHVVSIRSSIMISIITIIIIISNNTIIIMTNLILKVTVMLSPSAPELRRRGGKPILTNTLIWAIVMMAMTIMMVIDRITNLNRLRK